MTSRRKQDRAGLAMAPLLVSVLLLVGLMADKILFHLPTGDSEAYHARVIAVAEQIPWKIGDWVGREEEVAQSAIELLRDPTICSRVYSNLRTQREIGFLLVHCRQARDLQGHYPPRCYPASGWMEVSRVARDWTVRAPGDAGTAPVEKVIPGSEYRFTYTKYGVVEERWIHNFLLLPDGVIERDMDGVYQAAADPRRKSFGAGQVQIIFTGRQWSDPADRDEVFGTLIAELLPVIEAINAEVSE